MPRGESAEGIAFGTLQANLRPTACLWLVQFDQEAPKSGTDWRAPTAKNPNAIALGNPFGFTLRPKSFSCLSNFATAASHSLRQQQRHRKNSEGFVRAVAYLGPFRVPAGLKGPQPTAGRCRGSTPPTSSCCSA